MEKKHVIFAVMGLKPQVITQAMWYLKTQHKPDPIDISRIVVVTTAAGKKVLYEGNPSEGMRPFIGEGGVIEKFSNTYSIKPQLKESDIHVICDNNNQELDDIRDFQELEFAADTVVGTIRELAKNQDIELHCLYSGGRRALAVFLGLALTLAGRRHDHLYYVKVTPEEQKGEPIYYPFTDKFEITLEEIPFARLGEKYSGVFGSEVSYSQLVKNIQEQVDSVKAPITKIIDKPYHIVSKSKQMRKAVAEIEKIAKQGKDSTVLIYGETGTGKDLLARHFLKHCGRNPDLFFKAYCSEIANEAFERSMFGYYPDVPSQVHGLQKGVFQLASDGVVFLDDISGLPLGFQNKLLHFLDEWEITPLNSSERISTNVRLIMAISEDPFPLVRAKSMHRSFYDRIEKNIIRIPPLYKRKKDLPGLVELFVKEAAEKYEKKISKIDKSFYRDLKRFTWKSGNAKELRNFIERIVDKAECRGGVLSHIPRDLMEDERSRHRGLSKIIHRLKSKPKLKIALLEKPKPDISDFSCITGRVIGGKEAERKFLFKHKSGDVQKSVIWDEFVNTDQQNFSFIYYLILQKEADENNWLYRLRKYEDPMDHLPFDDMAQKCKLSDKIIEGGGWWSDPAAIRTLVKDINKKFKKLFGGKLIIPARRKPGGPVPHHGNYELNLEQARIISS